MKKVPISILCGIATIAVTIILYFTIIGNVFTQIIGFISLCGVVLAEGITTFLAYKSEGNPRKVSATIIFSVLIPIAVFLSIFYIANFPKGYGSYLGFYFASLLILAVPVAIIWAFSDRKKIENDDFQAAKNNMFFLRKKVKVIQTDPNAADYKKDLEEIEEKLHFSNDAVIMDNDQVLNELIDELLTHIGDSDFDIGKQIQEIKKVIDVRNILAKKTI